MRKCIADEAFRSISIRNSFTSSHVQATYSIVNHFVIASIVAEREKGPGNGNRVKLIHSECFLYPYTYFECTPWFCLSPFLIHKIIYKTVDMNNRFMISNTQNTLSIFYILRLLNMFQTLTVSWSITIYIYFINKETTSVICDFM